MTIRMLAWSVVLGLAYVLIAAGLMTRQRGLKWNTGNRDGDHFWARLVYLPIYLAGIPYLRTAVWAVSLWGILQVLEALL